MKQNDTKFHQLFLGLKEADDYFPKEDRGELLSLIKDLYEENLSLTEKDDDEGKYGIKYKTIDEDSRWSDSHEQFFNSKSKRDDVFDDWIDGRYWDNIFEQELQYRTPSPNVHSIVKVFRESGKIYEE